MNQCSLKYTLKIFLNSRRLCFIAANIHSACVYLVDFFCMLILKQDLLFLSAILQMLDTVCMEKTRVQARMVV